MSVFSLTKKDQNEIRFPAAGDTRILDNRPAQIVGYQDVRISEQAFRCLDIQSDGYRGTTVFDRSKTEFFSLFLISTFFTSYSRQEN